MKFNFAIEINEYDDICQLEDEIIERSARIFIENLTFGNRNTDLETRLRDTILHKLEDVMNMDFKESVSTKVTDNLVKKFERTKQYKELISNGEVVTDSIIKNGLKDLVSEIVRSEMKKMFK